MSKGREQTEKITKYRKPININLGLVIFSVLFQSCGNPVPASDIPSRSDNMSAKGYLLRGQKKGDTLPVAQCPLRLLLGLGYGIGHKDEDWEYNSVDNHVGWRVVTPKK